MKPKKQIRWRFVFLACLTLTTVPALAGIEHLPDEQAMTSDEKELLELEPARQYVLKLINRDRASVGAKPVTLDETAGKAGQKHSDEMAINGYISHWTMDGRKPDQRYNAAGGKDSVMENVYAGLEGSAYENAREPNKLPLHSAQVFHRYELDKIESSFFNEKPPNDGHRVNIIEPQHTAVGIGLSFASQFGMGVRTACAQEFINHYGDYDDIPDKVVLGESFNLKGTLSKNVKLKLIDMRWEELPKPMSVTDLNKTSSYGVPDKIVASYFADPTQTDDPIPVKKSDEQESFSLAIKTSKEWQPGLYYILVWADLGDGKDDAVISTRTIQLVEK